MFESSVMKWNIIKHYEIFTLFPLQLRISDRLVFHTGRGKSIGAPYTSSTPCMSLFNELSIQNTGEIIAEKVILLSQYFYNCAGELRELLKSFIAYFMSRVLEK